MAFVSRAERKTVSFPASTPTEVRSQHVQGSMCVHMLSFALIECGAGALNATDSKRMMQTHPLSTAWHACAGPAPQPAGSRR